jgi:hypothetical protein
VPSFHRKSKSTRRVKKMSADQPRCLASALAFASRGLSVFPLHSVVKSSDGRFVCTCGKADCGKNTGKHPLGEAAPHGHTDATTDRRKIEWWFRNWPHANLGLACDQVAAVDVDPRHNGDESLRRLEQEYGELPRTWRTISGGGGEHVLFRRPADVQIGCRTALLEGIDIKAGAGGYIVAPPSLHMSGRNYAWNVDFHPKDTPLAPMPTWLVELIRKAPESTAKSVEAWRALVRDGVVDGERNSSLTSLAGHLLRRFIDPLVTLELLLAWNLTRCQPPLTAAEVKATVGSIATRELARRKRI